MAQDPTYTMIALVESNFCFPFRLKLEDVAEADPKIALGMYYQC